MDGYCQTYKRKYTSSKKNEQYVMAAKALGVSDFFVIVKHILPNTIFPVLINATMRIGSMVITAAALSFFRSRSSSRICRLGGFYFILFERLDNRRNKSNSILVYYIISRNCHDTFCYWMEPFG